MARKKKKKSRSFAPILFLIVTLVAAFLVYRYYNKIFSSATSVENKEQFFYVHTNWERSDLVAALFNQNILHDTASFIWLSNQKEFIRPKPGRYLIKDNMSNNSLVNLLRSGKQQPVKVTFNSIRTYEDLAGNVSKQIEADSTELLNAFRDSKQAEKYGFTAATFLTLFIPNTYELYWNTTAVEFIERMADEYKRFWNPERIAKAKKIKLSQSEVSILASIVQAEQMGHPDERPKVAGLYINRLRKGMRLQSDPTLIFALGDFSIKRVLNEHKLLNSRFNTYTNPGLPPGPINLPEISSINAVLNYTDHNYIYMCAKADFSGYHNFSRTLNQHNVYANEYRKELNRRRIMR